MVSAGPDDRGGGVYVLLKGGGAWKPCPGGRAALRGGGDAMGGGEVKAVCAPVPGEGSAAATEPIPMKGGCWPNPGGDWYAGAFKGRMPGGALPG